MKIVAASCSKIQQIDPQPVWSTIKEEEPDVLMLLGDNIYLDRNRHKDPNKLRKELRELYSRQVNEHHFQELINDLSARGAKLLVTYDDHDFIGNNRYGADEEPELGEVAREELLRAFSVPTTNGDIYSHTKTTLVDIVMLDERFYRQSPEEARGDRDAILGEKQWFW
ncbi:MAG: alkaline phosphatase D family protein, partial [Candidatus Thiodiazotropha sp.]